MRLVCSSTAKLPHPSPSITRIRNLPSVYTRNLDCLCPDVLSFEQVLEWSYFPTRTTAYKLAPSSCLKELSSRRSAADTQTLVCPLFPTCNPQLVHHVPLGKGAHTPTGLLHKGQLPSSPSWPLLPTKLTAIHRSTPTMSAVLPHSHGSKNW